MADNKQKKNEWTVLLVTDDMTLEDMINRWQPELPVGKKKLSSKEFLDITDDSGLSNLEKIWGRYDSLEKEKYKNDKESGNLTLIKAGTDNLAFPIKDSPFLLQKPAREGQFLEQGDFNAYWSENYETIIKDQSFVPEHIVASDEEEVISTRVIPLNIRVWIYLKSIDKVIDVSSYVVGCSTNKTKKNGTFNITISPFYNYTDIMNFGDTSINSFNNISNTRAQVKEFLEKNVQTNDIVFIRFERLKLEKESDVELNSLEIPLSKLANNDSNINVWDMIGIVDGCSSVYNSSINARAFILEGRDFSKLFTDDGSYFLPLKEIENTFNHWWDQGAESDPWYQRNIITGKYDYLWFYGFKPIREMIWFIINYMSNLGLVDDKVFASWKDKRTKSYEIDGLDPLSVKGIWQIVKVFVDKNLENRVIVDPSISNPNGTLMDYMNRVCQEPFVEFYFDTYVNTLDLIVRQPPFTEKAIMDTFKSKKYITIAATDIYETSLTYDDRVYSWYQIHLQNINVGNKDTTSLAFVPIVYLNEFTELYGNKKLEITDIYLSYQETEGVEQTEQMLPMQAAALNDLMYLIETNSYLPFTRKGTIVINGDRRIKVGTFVLCEFTNEFFYVESVTNIISFESGVLQRQTILQVERGMYVPILESNLNSTKKRKDNSDSESGSVTPSYFKIIDLESIKQAISQVKSGTLATLQSPKINKEQFDYFLKRKMYRGGE